MTALTGDLAEQLRRSGLFDAGWYLSRHGDLRQLGLAPFDHYCRIGAALQRDPGPGFSCRAYLSANPDVARAGLNPLVHYLQTGKAEGRALRQAAPPADLARAQHLRQLLETGGLTERPLAALRALADGPGILPDAAALAAEVLAVWDMRPGGDAHEACFRLEQRLSFNDAGGLLRLSPLLLVAQMRAGQRDRADKTLKDAPWSPDLELAATWLDPSAEARVLRLSRLFRHFGLAAVDLQGDGPSGFDRLCGGVEQAGDGTTPVVSVLIAAHDAISTLPTALASLQRQTLTAWEAIVIDDASTDGTADLAARLAARDPRIRLLRQAANRGAYAARNAGLSLARGAFVTLLDADDWAHPEKLARQVAAMTAGLGLAGCMTMQARTDEDLRITRWTGTGAIMHEDTSSLLLPRAILADALGGWRAWRVSADSELLRRARRMFGAAAIRVLYDTPAGFQRDQTTNATLDPASGMGWFYYGARHEAHEAQAFHHPRAPSLKSHADSPLPVPRLIGTEPDRKTEFALNRVYCGLMCVQDAGLAALLDWLDQDAKAGRSAGLVPLWSSALAVGPILSVHPMLRARVDGQSLRVLVYGETLRCDRFFRLPGQHVDETQRYLPHVSDASGPVLWPGTAPDAARTVW